jgi:hypothetical protein
MPHHLSLQKHQGHINVPGNSHLRQETTGHSLEKYRNFKQGMVQKGVSRGQLPQH